MDRDQRSRQQKSRDGSFSRSRQKRSLGSRLGLQKQGSTVNSRSNQKVQPPPDPLRSQPGHSVPPRQQHTRPQLNPQKAGYIPGAPRRQRRVTQAELLRRRNRRRALGVLGVLAVLALGAIVSINLLFKVTAFRVETFDRTTPADTGIYTEDEIIAALGIEQGSSLFGFSTTEKTMQLQSQFPYLDNVQVDVQLPGTVVIKVKPATERFTCMYSGGWVILSSNLKILRSDISQPEGLTVLSCSLPADFSPEPGRFVVPVSYNSLLEGEGEATMETAQATATDVLAQMMEEMEAQGLSEGVTAVNISDLSNLSFDYQERIQVLLGNSNRLDYKIRLASVAILDPDKGLSSSDKGTLDVSYQQTDGEIKGYFAPDEPDPTPTPTPETDEGGDEETDTSDSSSAKGEE